MGIRERTEQKVFSYIEEHRMIVSGDRIAAGVSGGADSLCLLFMLMEYAKRVPLTLSVVHVNHGIRQDAAEDARYVEALCRREGLPFFLTSADVRALAKQEKCSPEDAGRRLRYRAFYKAAEDMGGGKIAVAHNSNDNAETMLFHLFRGSGLKGLCGISAVRDEIIRPILCLERREAEAYLQERGIAWCTDSTNGGDDYSRNRIRHHILPYAEKEIFVGTVGHMARTAEILEETEDFLEQQTEEALGQCLAEEEEAILCEDIFLVREPYSKAVFEKNVPQEVLREGGTRKRRYVLKVKNFQSFHIILQKRMLHRLIRQLSLTGKDIHQVHIRDTLTLFTREGTRSVSLPFGISARRQYDYVILERGSDTAFGELEPETGKENPSVFGMPSVGKTTESSIEETAESSIEETAVFSIKKTAVPSIEKIAVPSMEEISAGLCVYDLGNVGKLEFTVFLAKNWMQIPENRYTKWFDCDKIEESLVIRSRCTGDYLTIAQGTGNMVHKSLKNYMVTEKIPRQLREKIPVVAAGSHVLWLVGWRISEYFKVSSGTKHILQIRWLQEESTNCVSSETEEKDVRTH